MDKMEVSEVVEVTEEVEDSSTQAKVTTPKKRSNTLQEGNATKSKKPR